MAVAHEEHSISASVFAICSRQTPVYVRVCVSARECVGGCESLGIKRPVGLLLTLKERDMTIELQSAGRKFNPTGPGY